jgi:hypothetical protein
MNFRSAWQELSETQRRWIFLNAVVIAAVINGVLNAAIAWVSVRSEESVPLWAVPVVDQPSVIADTIGTLFLLPLITCLIITTAAWHDIRKGSVSRLARPPISRRHWDRLPKTRLRRGLVLGAICTVLLAAPAVLALVALDFGDLSVGEFVLYKAIFGVALGALVTPPIGLLALADSPAPVVAEASAS